MLTALTLLLLTSSANARDAELAIISAHLPSLSDEQAQELANALSEAVSDLDNVSPVSPGELRGRIIGRESLIVEGIFLGPGRSALEEGRILYDRGEFESAVPVLEDAASSLQDGLAGTGDSKDLIDTLLLLGLAHAALGEDDAARAAFSRVVIIEPQRQLDHFNYPPKIVRLFTEIRDAALSGERVALTVISPEGVQIFVDGRVISRTDRSTVVSDLIPGNHSVLVIGEDGHRFFDLVSVESNSTVRADLDQRTIAPTATSPEGRITQTEQLYRALGEYADTSLILLAGETQPGVLGVQFYEPHTGNFSRMEEVSLGGGDPLAALTTGVRRLDAYVDDGQLKVDFLQLDALSLDINANPLLSSLLLDPEPIVETIIERRTPWYVWAGAGTLVVGSAATAAVILSGDGPSAPVTTGTVVVNLPD